MNVFKPFLLPVLTLTAITLFSNPSLAKKPLCERLYQSAIEINDNLVWKYDKKLKKKIPVAYGFKLWSQYTGVKFGPFIKYPGFNACARTFSAMYKKATGRLPLKSDVDRGRVWRMQGFLPKNGFKTIAVDRLKKKCQKLKEQNAKRKRQNAKRKKKNAKLPRKKRKVIKPIKPIKCKTYKPQRGDVIVWRGTKGRTKLAKKLGYPNARLQHIGVYIGGGRTMDSYALSGEPEERNLNRGGYEVEYAYRPRGNCK